MEANSGVILPDGSTATDADGNELVTDDAGLCPGCCNPCGSCAATCRTCAATCGDCTPRIVRVRCEDIAINDIVFLSPGDVICCTQNEPFDPNLQVDLRLVGTESGACVWRATVPANLTFRRYGHTDDNPVDGEGLCDGTVIDEETVDHVTITLSRSRSGATVTDLLYTGVPDAAAPFNGLWYFYGTRAMVTTDCSLFDDIDNYPCGKFCVRSAHVEFSGTGPSSCRTWPYDTAYSGACAIAREQGLLDYRTLSGFDGEHDLPWTSLPSCTFSGTDIVPVVGIENACIYGTPSEIADRSTYIVMQITSGVCSLRLAEVFSVNVTFNNYGKCYIFTDLFYGEADFDPCHDTTITITNDGEDIGGTASLAFTPGIPLSLGQGGTASFEVCPSDADPELYEPGNGYDPTPCIYCNDCAAALEVGDCGCCTPNMYGVTVSDVEVCFDEDITAGDDDGYVYNLSGTTDPNRQIDLEQDPDNNCRWFAQIESDHVLIEKRTNPAAITLTDLRYHAVRTGDIWFIEAWLEGDGESVKVIEATTDTDSGVIDLGSGNAYRYWTASDTVVYDDDPTCPLSICDAPRSARCRGYVQITEYQIGGYDGTPAHFAPNYVGVYLNFNPATGSQTCAGGVATLTSDSPIVASGGTYPWTETSELDGSFTGYSDNNSVLTLPGSIANYNIDTIRYEFTKTSSTLGTWGVIGYDGETPRVRYVTNYYSESPACKITPIEITSIKCRPGTTDPGAPVLHGSGACCAKSNATGNFGSEGQTVFESCEEDI